MKEECNPKRKEEYCPMEGRNTNGVKIYYEYWSYLFLIKGIKEMKTMSTSMFHYVSKGCIN